MTVLDNIYALFTIRYTVTAYTCMNRTH